MHIAERERILEVYRELTQALEGGDCSIDPLSEFTTPSAETKRTLLTSYPGGKRFAWLVISALTNHDVADDWNFSGKLDENVLTLKTSWPHADSVWSWNDQMDQTILLIRNPRWAIPAYHTVRYELDFATDFASSLVRIPFLYTIRPAVAVWEAWRDENFETELDAYIDHINYWMEGGRDQTTGDISTHCSENKIECRPKEILDFDTFYKENPDTEFYKLGTLLDDTFSGPESSVEVLAAQARVCALDKVYDTPELLHDNSRTSGPLSPQFRFTSAQLQIMEDRLVETKNKYLPQVTNKLEEDLVYTLTRYINLVNAEKTFQLQIESQE